MTETLAIAVWGDRISPVFDSSESLLILHKKAETITDREKIKLQGETPVQRAQELAGAHITTLICGAISLEYENEIAATGIRLLSFIAGNVEPVIESYLRGESLSTVYHMPGCGRRHQHRNNRRARQNKRRF